MKIPLAKPLIGAEEEHAVVEVLRSGWLTQGPQVEAFERELGTYLGAQHVVATSSCTTSLHIALLLAGIGPGDEVICPSYSFVATANAVLYVGAKPVFAEVRRDTFNLDPEDVGRRVSARTKAILVADQVGLPAALDELDRLAQQHGVVLIEDAACALGATYHGRRLGSFGRLVCFSFHPRKCVTTGEGGVVVADDAALAARARLLRSHGMGLPAVARHAAGGVAVEQFLELGYNYRMGDLAAALGRVQLGRLDGIIARRRELASRYREKLSRIGGVTVPVEPEETTHTYQSYLVTVEGPPLDDVVQKLAARGVASRRGIPGAHTQTYMIERAGVTSLPTTEWLSAHTLFLPLYPQMTDADQDEVVAALAAAMETRPT